MPQTDDLEFDQDFADVVKRNPTAAMVIEMRYLRRDFSLLNEKVEKMQKQCPCQTVIDQGNAIASMQGEGCGREKTGNNVIAWIGVIISVASVAILILSKVA